MKTKKIVLYRKGYEDVQGRYNSVEEAQRAVRNLVEDEEKGTIFDYFYKEEDYEEMIDRVKTYEDACRVLGVEPIDEQNAKARGFRPDEIARRKLETITASLNEGWKPDWNNTDQRKYYPYFYIQENAKGEGFAGLSSNTTYYSTERMSMAFGPRLCFHASHLAQYAGSQFINLYEQLSIEKI